MDARLITFLATVTSSLVCVMSVIPVPSVHPGFVLQGTRNSEIVVEVFLELNCKDSKETWPILKQAASKYKPYEEHMSFILHMFPLPYHRCGFMSSQAWNMVIDSHEDEAVSFIEAAYRELDFFSNLATINKTNSQIESELANLVKNSTGISVEQFAERFKDFATPTKIQWKYAVKRGVAGTPWFFVNGVELSVPAVAFPLETWENILEPLLDSSPHLRQLKNVTFARLSTTPSTTPSKASKFPAFSMTIFMHTTLVFAMLTVINI